MDKRTLKFKPAFSPIFNSLMTLLVRCAVPIIIFYLIFDASIGFNPHYIAMMVIISIGICLVYVAVMVVAIQAVFQVRVSSDGLYSSTNSFFKPFMYISWVDIADVRYRKWFELEFLMIRSGNHKMGVQIPLYLKDFTAFKENALKHIGHNNPLYLHLK